MSQPEAETAPPQPQFRFARLIVRRTLFEELPRAEQLDGEQRPDPLPVDVTIGATVQINPENQRGLVGLDVAVRPNLKWQPYRIEVSILGAFVAENAPIALFDQFCRNGAPPILFPYIREIVHRMTRDGAHGHVLLDPINIQQILDKSEWKAASAEQKAVSDSTAP